MAAKKKIFMIAGEESGDNLGSKLIKSIKQKSKNEVEFIGVGGSKMAFEGLSAIFPMQDINLMGFMEIIPHIKKLKMRIDQTVERIIEERPDVLITIDSPGFNFRVAKRIKQLGLNIKLVHYVAPSVWAYKKGRAKKTAKLFDQLICILPWEPKYFEAEGLKTTFIGHPIFEDLNFLSDDEKAAFKNDYNYKESDKLVAILPGSRRGELSKMLNIFVDAANKISVAEPDVKFILMPTETLRGEVAKVSHKVPNCIVVSETEEKRKLLQICDAAIVKSGTVALEVAALKCPNLICYKVNSLSHWLIRRMLYINLANLINISADKEIIRELIQEDCNAEMISKEVLKLVNGKMVAKGQLEDAKFELESMGLGFDEKPSDKAADIILGIIN